MRTTRHSRHQARISPVANGTVMTYSSRRPRVIRRPERVVVR